MFNTKLSLMIKIRFILLLTRLIREYGRFSLILSITLYWLWIFNLWGINLCFIKKIFSKRLSKFISSISRSYWLRTWTFKLFTKSLYSITITKILCINTFFFLILPALSCLAYIFFKNLFSTENISKFFKLIIKWRAIPMSFRI